LGDEIVVFRLVVASLVVSAFPVVGQPALHLKTRTITTQAAVALDLADTPYYLGAGHFILQFNTPPGADVLTALTELNISVLGGIPDNALIVSLNYPVFLSGFGIVYAAPLDASDKISPLLASSDQSATTGYFLVEFHPDVDLNVARAAVHNLGLTLVENPDLSAHHLLFQVADPTQVRTELTALASQDIVAYIFPASSDLAAGVPSRPCAGAVSTLGPIGQLIPTSGQGWGGAGVNPATVGYVFSNLTSQLPAPELEQEIQRAMAEWSKVVQVTWSPGTDANAAQTVNIFFATGAHGDPYPFGGPGGVLAHTFYPAPPNPEPIAGDMHFNDADTWKIGTNTDVFSVALHELGHALGLAHSDSPADVMYPYNNLNP
jgi:hypothetical protein